MNKILVNGTIVLCDTTSTGEDQLKAGAVGAVMLDTGFTDFAFSYPLPVTNLGADNSSEIYNYIKSTRYICLPTIYIRSLNCQQYSVSKNSIESLKCMDKFHSGLWPALHEPYITPKHFTLWVKNTYILKISNFTVNQWRS